MAAGDVSIRVVSRRLVKASDPSIQPHVAPVSNLDLYACNVQMFMLCLYPNIPNASAVVATFEALLPSLLNHFYPLAGRIGTNPSSGLPELVWDNQGAELVVGEANVSLGSLDYREGAAQKKMTLPFPEEVVLSIQLLSYPCGGFTVVWASNHLLMDGHTITAIINAWSELARTGRTISGIGAVSRDTSVLRPRSQPSYSDFLASMFTTYDEHRLPNALTADASFVDRLYYVDGNDVAALRDTASTGAWRSTRVQAVSAYLWKQLASAVALAKEERCRMGWWVSARPRVRAPELVAALQQKDYFGNATLYALGDAAVDEILRKPLSEVAAMVRDAVTSPDYDRYVQEMVDWVEVHKTEGGLMEAAVLGVGAPTVNLSVMGTFPLNTDFGFGQATMAMPVSDFGRLCSAYLSVGARPGGDGSWIVSAYIWPQLAAALEGDGLFKPVTPEYLGLIAL